MKKSPTTVDVLDAEASNFNEQHSAAIRIWHWVFFLVISASLVTVLLSSTVFRTRNTLPLVQEQLQQKGVTLSQDQARSVAHAFNDQLWDLHRIIGLVIVGLLVCRLLIELSIPRREKLLVKLKKAIGFVPKDEMGRRSRYHYLGVKWGYIIFIY